MLIAFSYYFAALRKHYGNTGPVADFGFDLKICAKRTKALADAEKAETHGAGSREVEFRNIKANTIIFNADPDGAFIISDMYLGVSRPGMFYNIEQQLSHCLKNDKITAVIQ